MRLALAFVLSIASTLAALDTVSVSMLKDVAYERDEVAATFRLSRGTATSGNLAVGITLSGTALCPGGSPGTADYAISGSGISGYAASGLTATATVTIPNGSSSVDIIVTPNDDVAIEMRETVILTIVANSGVYLRGSQFTQTMLIADDDLTLTWVPIKTDVAETLKGGSPQEAAVRLQFSQPPPAGVTVQYQLLAGDGEATLNTDYLMTYMTRSMSHRQPGSILDDRSVTLHPIAETWTVGCKVSAVVTKPSNVVPVYDASQLEEDDWVRFGSSVYLYKIETIDRATNTLTLFQATEENISKDTMVRNNIDVAITTNGSIEGIDIDPDEFGVDIAVTPKYDNIPEGAESVAMRLISSPDYYIESPTDMQLSIADDDVLVSLVAVKDAVESPLTNGIARLNLSAAAPRNLTIPIKVGTPDLAAIAVSGVDFVALPSEILVPQGSLGVDINVIPLNGQDAVRTMSIELVDTTDIVLAGAAGSAGSVAVINIRDGSAVSSYGTVTIISPAGKASDATPVIAADLRLHIDRAGITNPDVTVPLVVSGAAIPSIDYVSLPSTVTLPELLAAADVAAGSSFIQVVLSTSTTAVSLPAGSTLRIGSGTMVTVKTAVTVDSSPTFVELTAALGAPVTASTSIGVNDLVLAVTPIADALDEGDEILTVTLNQPGDANFSVGSPGAASVTITDGSDVGPVDPVITPKPPIGSGSAAGGGCGLGGGSALILAGLGLGFALRRRRN